jgi:hypothetical protein
VNTRVRLRKKRMDPVQRLTQVGFIKVGRWNLKSGTPCYSLDELAAATDVLYAFVSAEQVLYLGKTTKELRRRMPGYQRPGPTQRTNIACHAKLMKVLTVQETVDILRVSGSGAKAACWSSNQPGRGPEDGLILEFRPPWNKGGL